MIPKDKTKEGIMEKIGILLRRISGIKAPVSLDNKIRENANLLSAIVESSDDAIIGKDLNSIITSWNKGAQYLYGYTEKEAINQSVLIIIPEERRVELETIMRKIKNGERIEHFETLRQKKDGTKFPVSLTFSPIKDSYGKICGASSIAHDITEHKRMELKLRESEAKIRVLFDQTFRFMGLLTVEGILIEINKTALEISGVDAASVLNKPFWQGPWWAHSLELQEKLRQGVGKAARGEFIYLDASYVDKEGILHYSDFSIKPAKDETGKVVFLITEGRDIIERKRAEEALEYQANLQKLSSMLSSSFVESGDLDTKINYALKLLGEFFNADRAYVFQLRHNSSKIDNSHEWCAPKAQSQISQLQNVNLEEQLPWLWKTLQAKETFYFASINNLPVEANLEKTYFKKRGILSIVVVPIMTDDRLIGFLGLTSTSFERAWSENAITMIKLIGETIGHSLDRKRADEALRESENKYRNLVFNIPGITYRCANNADLTMYFISDEVQRLLGYPASDFINNAVRSYMSVIHSEDRELVNRAMQEGVSEGKPYVIEYRLYRQDGGIIWVQDRGRGIVDSGGAFLWLEGVTLDITESKKIGEESIKRAKELEIFYKASIGREERIIELKTEVARLKKELGK
jgi:PAS domain S-box-containing protein